jgi:hypothetical protein
MMSDLSPQRVKAGTGASNDGPTIVARANVLHPSGQWRDDDYDVLEDGVIIGRIFFLDVVGPQTAHAAASWPSQAWCGLVAAPGAPSCPRTEAPFFRRI